MSLGIYKVTEWAGFSGQLGDTERDFLVALILDKPRFHIYVDEDFLESTIQAWQEKTGQAPPKELIEWLKEQIKDGGVEFAVE